MDEQISEARLAQMQRAAQLRIDRPELFTVGPIVRGEEAAQQEAAWAAERQRELMLSLRQQALTGALHTCGGIGDEDRVVAAAETYLRFLSGGVQ